MKKEKEALQKELEEVRNKLKEKEKEWKKKDKEFKKNLNRKERKERMRMKIITMKVPTRSSNRSFRTFKILSRKVCSRLKMKLQSIQTR